jgi:hypothetical protein
MAKGLPYFKFTPSEWLTGDICFEDLEVQGLFINICAWYWQRDGNLKISDIEKRYNKPTALNSLYDRFLNVENDTIQIVFLDEQLIDRNHISKTNSFNGSKGGRPKTKEIKPTAFNSLTESKPNENPIRKEEEKKRIRKDNTPRKISFEESNLFDKIIFKEAFTDWSQDKLRHYYDAALRYSVEGNKYVSWELAIKQWERKDKINNVLVEKPTQKVIIW